MKRARQDCPSRFVDLEAREEDSEDDEDDEDEDEDEDGTSP